MTLSLSCFSSQHTSNTTCVAVFGTSVNNCQASHHRVIAALWLLQCQRQQAKCKYAWLCCCWTQTSTVTSSVMDLALQQKCRPLLTQVCFLQQQVSKAKCCIFGSNFLIIADTAQAAARACLPAPCKDTGEYKNVYNAWPSERRNRLGSAASHKAVANPRESSSRCSS